MIDQNQLHALCADIESDRVERTESTDNTNKFCEAVCAFANDLPNHQQPGYLLIGVRNDGSLSGLTVTDQLLQNLAAIRADGNVLPQPAINVARIALPGGAVAVVEVHPSDLPPVRYKGRVYVRVGPRRGIANEQEERMLSERRIARARSFDATPCPQGVVSDLALGQFDAYRRVAIDPSIIEANHRSIEEQLASLRFYDLRRNCPTFAGILLFGKSPRFYLPGAYIQFLRLPGTQLTDRPVDQAEISGDLLSVLRELDFRIKMNIRTSLNQVSGTLRETLNPDYSDQAIRELVMNAVMHRNYESNTPIRFYWFSNRIEVQSPGGLYGEATPQNFPSRNSYRNPVIAEAMKELGYVNRYGYGVRRAQALLLDNGNPEPRFEFDPNSVLAVIPGRPA
ncbi:MAG TPA: transcriptional regulator [Verrucomicrobia bacterium]|nr:MAG: transcriptional regulator [Lentisphaerae bacterium GWF2_57_35]HBA83052.1 transcriptional regulator [Verrucomicrobiota bacterium]